MSKRQPPRSSRETGRDVVGRRSVIDFQACRVVALAVFIALFVATLLVPSESAAQLGTGAVLTMLWLLLLVGWLATSFAFGECRFRFGWVDAAVVGVVACHTISAVVMAPAGRPRATINALWLWLSFGVFFLLARQLLRGGVATRAVGVVGVSLAVGLSAFGYFQYFYSMPQQAARYAADPEGELQAAGIDLEPESPERKLFEDRLRSTEPMGTFALANSLAGFLTPWLIVALGIGLASWQDQRLRWPMAAAGGVCLLVMGGCLLMTKSRTAVLAVGFGMMLLGLVGRRKRWSFDWRIAAAGGGILAVLVVGVVAAGALDRLVISEAPKSVLYRLQYWRSTLAMIADHPWFGCGPGNFQQYYTAYKLPEASETIADPHNFLLEVWATAGTPAMLALLAVLGVFAWRLLRAAARREEQPAVAGKLRAAGAGRGEATVDREPTVARWHVWCLFAGALLGLLLAQPCRRVAGFPVEWAIVWVGLPPAVVCALLLHPWLVRGSLPVWLPTVALIALLVNLLAAGGMSFPGVALNVWLLLAIALDGLDAQRRGKAVPRVVAGGLALAAVLLTLLFHQSMYQPVLRCRTLMDEATGALRDGQPAWAERLLREAVSADPRSEEPWMAMASLHHQLAIGSGSPEQFAQFDRAVHEALMRNRRSHSMYTRVGDWRLAQYRATDQPRFLRDAIEAYAASARLYPNSSMVHVRAAWACYLAGDRRRATREADTAWALDQRTPHKERKLACQKVSDPFGEPLGCRNAEQLVQVLRKMHGTRGAERGK